MRIDLANAADLKALCKLLEILFSQEEEFLPDPDVQSRGLSRIIDDPQVGRIIVARDGNEVVGMVNLLFTISTALGARVALLEDMVVLPKCRDAGVGSRLLEYAVDFARQHGCQRITLLTDRSNTSAQRFYQKHGFSLSAMVPMRLMLSND